VSDVADQGGFSLLEILIVLTIVSILAIIALPVYLDYKVRAKIAEGFVLADPVKNMVVDHYLSSGNWPSSNASAGIQDPTSFRTANVDTISVSGSKTGTDITITYLIPALGSDNTIILTMKSATANPIQWICTQGTVINKYRPASCQP
jgi:type IV pilus assembly protein PilA